MTLVTKYLWAFFPLPRAGRLRPCGEGLARGLAVPPLSLGTSHPAAGLAGTQRGVTRGMDVEVTVLVSLPSDF